MWRSFCMNVGLRDEGLSPTWAAINDECRFAARGPIRGLIEPGLLGRVTTTQSERKAHTWSSWKRFCRWIDRHALTPTDR